jgi:hypothetical protein
MMEDLLEDIRTIIGCEFISDLRHEPFNNRARKLISILDLELYPFADITDAVSYLFFSEIPFKSVQQVKEFIQCDFYRHNISQKNAQKITSETKVPNLAKA